MKRAFTEVVRPDTGGDVAIFAPFTRIWCVDRFFDSLAASDVPFGRGRFVAYVDHNDRDLVDAVKERAASIPFAEVFVHCSAWQPPAEFARSRERRGRHGAMRTASVGLVPADADWLLLLEDDTTVPEKVWQYGIAAINKGYDWVSGFEVGRWSCTCPGLWLYDDLTLNTPMPAENHLVDVDATGIFCVLTRPEVYAAVKWDVWDADWGHDVSITYALKQKGYRLGVDWRLECVHMTQDGDLTCDMATPLTRRVGPLDMQLQAYPNLRPLTSFSDEGPKLVRRTTKANPFGDNTFYRFGEDIEYDGVVYPKRTRVPRTIAKLMYEDGLISRRIT